MTEVKFNEGNLLRFLSEFDYIFEKYGINKNDYDRIDEYLKCLKKETIEQSADVMKRDYSYIYDNIRLVYGDDEKAQRMMHIYRIVKEEIVNKFLNIPGLERIYDEHFFEFEWDMHSKLDFDKHDISFYRDHFVHQVRNLYEMYELLNQRSESSGICFFDDLKKWFDYGDNKVSSYIRQAIDKMLIDQENSLFNKLDNPRDAYINYIIKAAVALSALFHDIGYPVLHFEGLRDRIAVFMPSLYMFMGGEGNNFEHVYSHLYNSFLFRTVGKDELKREIRNHDNHGAVSAIAFLLTFYQNGVIYNIPQEKKLAIEIAALAIYDHTLKYTCLGDDKAREYFRPVYRKNPIAYMLRICDDMQEWERAYFEIKDIPELITCSVCGNTFMRQKKDYYNEWLPSIYEYKCNYCKNIVMRGDNNYSRRKIIDIINCKEVRLKFFYKESAVLRNFIYIFFDYSPTLLLRMCVTSPNFSKYRINELSKLKKILMTQRFGGYDETIVDFILSPNPFILKSVILCEVAELDKNEICFANEKLINLVKNGYVKLDKNEEKTIKNKIKGLYIFNQICRETRWHINFTEDENLWEDEWDKMVKITNKCRTNINAWMDKFYITKDELAGEKSATNKISIYGEREKSVVFYLLLYMISIQFKIINSYRYETDFGSHCKINMEAFRVFIVKQVNNYAEDICGTNFTDDMRIFIADAIKQYSKMFDNKKITSKRMNTYEYYETFKTDNIVYDAVSHYCHIENYINAEPHTLNFYLDYDLFVNLYDSYKLVKKIIEYKEL